jgi:pyoverdine/dityrosine biosynthesis protein Dit1
MKILFLWLLLLIVGNSSCSTWRLKTVASNDISSKVINVLNRYRVETDINKESIGIKDTILPKENIIGYDVLTQKIETFIKFQQKLRLFLVSFPFKSFNREKKVLGPEVDLAERKSLLYIYEMIKELKAIYPYGVELVIFCDGAPFADYRGISDSDVKAYEDGLILLTKDMPEITIIGSFAIAKKIGALNSQEIRTRIDTYRPSNEDVIKLINTDQKIKESYLTLLERFKLEFDSQNGRSFLLKNNGLENVIQLLIARELRMRNFIEENFDPTTYIRLSVNYSTDVGKKFAIRLSPNSLIMPYHGVLVEDKSGAWSLRFKKDIDLDQYEEASQMINGKICRYMKER